MLNSWKYVECIYDMLNMTILHGCNPGSWRSIPRPPMIPQALDVWWLIELVVVRLDMLGCQTFLEVALVDSNMKMVGHRCAAFFFKWRFVGQIRERRFWYHQFLLWEQRQIFKFMFHTPKKRCWQEGEGVAGRHKFRSTRFGDLLIIHL